MSTLFYIFRTTSCRFRRVRRQPYIPKGWPTREEAEAELEDLLRPHHGTKWMTQLVVQARAVKSVVVSGVKEKAPPAEANGA